MKKINNFEEFVNENQLNESWREVKAFLKLPQLLIEKLLKKLIHFVPQIGIYI